MEPRFAPPLVELDEADRNSRRCHRSRADDVRVARALNGVGPCHRGSHRARSGGGFGAVVGHAGHAGHGVHRGRAAAGSRGVRRDRPRELGRDRASAGGGDTGAGFVQRRLAYRSPSASPRGRGAHAPARHRAAADDRARRRCRSRDLRAAEHRRGSDPVDRAGADRRRTGPGRRDRAACPGPDSPGAERRERAQRRHLRAPAVRGRGRGRRRIGDLGGPQRCHVAARGDRLRGCRWAGGRARGRGDRHPRRSPGPDRGPVATGDSGRRRGACLRDRQRARRLRLHRRIRCRDDLPDGPWA